MLEGLISGALSPPAKTVSKFSLVHSCQHWGSNLYTIWGYHADMGVAKGDRGPSVSVLTTSQEPSRISKYTVSEEVCVLLSEPALGTRTGSFPIASPVTSNRTAPRRLRPHPCRGTHSAPMPTPVIALPSGPLCSHPGLPLPPHLPWEQGPNLSLVLLGTGWGRWAGRGGGSAGPGHPQSEGRLALLLPPQMSTAWDPPRAPLPQKPPG